VRLIWHALWGDNKEHRSSVVVPGLIWGKCVGGFRGIAQPSFASPNSPIDFLSPAGSVTQDLAPASYLALVRRSPIANSERVSAPGPCRPSPSNATVVVVVVAALPDSRSL
jgi:hypothetical protein